jgi:hypothetical protein
MLSTSSRLSHPAPSGRYPPGLSFVGVTILNSSAGAEDAASPRMMTRISSGEISQNSAVLARRSHSVLATLQQFGNDVAIDAAGLITGGTSLPARSFTYQGDPLAGSLRPWPAQ